MILAWNMLMGHAKLMGFFSLTIMSPLVGQLLFLFLLQRRYLAPSPAPALHQVSSLLLMREEQE